MKTYRFVPVFLLFILFLGCQDTLSCIIPREPELPNKQFPLGSTDSYYYAELDGSVNNEPRDNDYDYFFDVVGLPVGLDYFVNFRTISIEGVPELSGTYDITIYLDIDGPFRDFNNEDPELLCNYSTRKNYTLIIE